MPKEPSHLAFPSKTHGSNHSSKNTASQGSHTHHTPYNRPSVHNQNQSSQGSNNRTSHAHLPRQRQQQVNDDGDSERLELSQENMQYDDFGDLQLTQEELDDFDDDTIAAAAAASEIEDDDDEEDDTRKNTATPTVRTATATTSVRTMTQPTTTTSTPATTTRTTTGTVKCSVDPNGQINSQQAFTAFLDRLKSGKERAYTHTRAGQYTYQDFIRVPDQFLFIPRAPLQHRSALDYDEVQRQFLLEIFPDLQSAPVRSQTVMSNVILTERDDEARTYNERVLKMQAHLSTLQAQQGRPVVSQGDPRRGGGGSGGRQAMSYQEKTYTAISLPLDEKDYEMQDMVTAHWLNPPGMPPHEITLRVGHQVILVKHISQRLPAGTRLIITRLGDHVIEAEVAMGPSKGESFLLPNMPCTSSYVHEIGCKFTRTQYPIKHAFALSLRDAVGSNVPGLVGLDLRSHVSEHRQLYFLMSCCADYRNLRVYVEDGTFPGYSGKYTRNPV